MRRRAVVWIKAQPHYRREAFVTGLQRLGFNVTGDIKDPGPGDVLVSWNMYPSNEAAAQHWKQCGAQVLIAENGYIGTDKHGHQLYALSRDGHNGSGSWYVGPEDRWARLGIALQPWRELHAGNGFILVCAQRGIGSKLMASPPGWHRRVCEEQSRFRLELRVRQHPGSCPVKTPLEQDWSGARGLLIWSSGAGVKALIAGIPVCYAAPHWICESAATRYEADRPVAFERLPRELALKRMAWAQWTCDELSSGFAFDCLLNQTPNS